MNNEVQTIEIKFIGENHWELFMNGKRLNHVNSLQIELTNYALTENKKIINLGVSQHFASDD